MIVILKREARGRVEEESKGQGWTTACLGRDKRRTNISTLELEHLKAMQVGIMPEAI
jgi:hypothetical protein